MEGISVVPDGWSNQWVHAPGKLPLDVVIKFPYGKVANSLQLVSPALIRITSYSLDLRVIPISNTLIPNYNYEIEPSSITSVNIPLATSINISPRMVNLSAIACRTLVSTGVLQKIL